MKNIETDLQSLLDGDTKLATLVKITRVDGSVCAFTTFDQDITLDGIVYQADGSFSLEGIKNEAALKANSIKAMGFIDSAALDEHALLDGVYDHAQIDIYICDWDRPALGKVQIRRGWFGEVTTSGGSLCVEMRGLHDLLQRKVGGYYTPECRHDLGCALCGVTLVSTSGVVSAVTNRAVFEDSNCQAASALFDYGQLTWTSGKNKGICTEVKKWDLENGFFTLWMPMPNPIVVGDAYQVLPGCDKKKSTCSSKYNNVINFGGFPHLPGLAKILQYPESS